MARISQVSNCRSGALISMEPQATIWELEPQTLGKHFVLRRYLDAWLPIMGTWSGRILFIDGFAGPGKYARGEDGSPLIALRALKEHAAKTRITAEVGFIFIEKGEARAEHLSRLVEEWKPLMPANCRLSVMNGVFDETMTQALDQLDAQQTRLAPCFVMVDPFGVSGTPMSIIRRILQNPQSEVYVSFMYEAINRFGSSPEFELHLDQLFGSPLWRSGIGIEDSRARKNFFYDLYETQLREAGAQYVVHFELYERGRLVYAIFFGTQHSRGCDRMKQAIWKVAPWGDFAFRGTRSAQLTLDITSPDFEPLKKALRMQYRRKGWVTIDEVMEFVASDRTDYHSGLLKRGALVPMEIGGEIEVDKSTRRRKRTYPAGTRLTFL